MTEQADTAALSFEQARDELQRVVAQLEQGSPTLEESLRLWERGEHLAQRCEEWLVGAKRRLDSARATTDGTATADGTTGGSPEVTT
ncbi:exodeoxyribonuclease VII small subunit [Microbacterium sp. LRZ72]|uniref:exodeoxyribonuclease VII small subunit n=1 Tax=Microbacterium sp. LRZ72 TaxID=2942481 RepID=UPI0029A36067|nr:exodeoxyribonuclease VII small subunit [Microbacterium sp. LRZ72]MDX2375800.1 exodeoxyribonuclease VII small subunit [Microbacterium sp. LRZ72]